MGMNRHTVHGKWILVVGLWIVWVSAAVAQDAIDAYFDTASSQRKWVTVAIDGYRRCELPAGGSCHFQISSGQHTYRIDQSDRSLEGSFVVPSSAYEFCMWLDDDGLDWEENCIEDW